MFQSTNLINKYSIIFLGNGIGRGKSLNRFYKNADNVYPLNWEW